MAPVTRSQNGISKAYTYTFANGTKITKPTKITLRMPRGSPKITLRMPVLPPTITPQAYDIVNEWRQQVQGFNSYTAATTTTPAGSNTNIIDLTADSDVKSEGPSVDDNFVAVPPSPPVMHENARITANDRIRALRSESEERVLGEIEHSVVEQGMGVAKQLGWLKGFNLAW